MKKAHENDPEARRKVVVELIARYRMLTRLSQQAIAEMLGLHAQTISNWIVGVRNPSLIAVHQLEWMVKRAVRASQEEERAERKRERMRNSPTATKAQSMPRVRVADRPIVREVQYGKL